MVALAAALFLTQAAERPYRLTPNPPATPVLTGPTIVGTRPLSPLRHMITATGKVPITYGASNLPPGLKLDSATGALTGSVGFPGSFRVRVKATNKLGSAERELRIVVGDLLALTPPLSVGRVDAQGKAAADLLRTHGWGFAEGDSGGLFKTVSGPGNTPGAFADWTRLEPASLDDAKVNWSAMAGVGQDVVVSITTALTLDQAATWSKVANTWRTNPPPTSWADLVKAWSSIDSWGTFAGPGHWNDPGPLLVGAGSPLTPSEQYTQVTLWCLLGAPLVVGTDTSKLDDFALNLLINDEVLAIHQDPLGRPGRLAMAAGDFEVWIKTLEGGGQAIGVFNKGETAGQATLDFGDPSVKAGLRVRDAWRQSKLRLVKNKTVCTLPRHGVQLLTVDKITDLKLRAGLDPKPVKGAGGGR